MGKKDRNGQFVWHELTTDNPEKALAFYKALFGWETRDFDMGPMGTYRIIRAGDREIGGLMKAPPGRPSAWLGYIDSDDVDAAAKRVSSHGGTIAAGPDDIPSGGRFAIATDPQGAWFALHKAGADEPPPQQDYPPQGQFCWDELVTTDPDAAARFYGEVIGWKNDPQKMPSVSGGTYLIQRLSPDKMAAGIMKNPMPDIPPHWMHYLAADDVDKMTNRARELGATVHVPPTEIPNMGRFSVLADPTGATIAFFQGG